MMLRAGNKRVPPLAQRGAVLSPVKLWVLAMLAPKPGLRVAPVPPQAANLIGPARACR